jgi:hypothetical protein
MKPMHLVLLSLFVVTVASPWSFAQERAQTPVPGREPGAPGAPEFQGQIRGELVRFDLMRGYIDLVERFSRLSRDPTTAGVAAVIAAGDLLKAQGPDAGVEYFTKALETAKNEAVRRAIRIQLVELYKQSGQHDKALEHLTDLINGAPAGAGGAEAQPPPPRPSGR